LATLFALLLPACEQERGKAQPPERLVLAVVPYTGAAPAFVAIDQGYFELEGLQVTVQRYPTGKAALDAVMNGEAEVATVAELPVTLAVLKGSPVTIFATLSTQTDYAVLGRIDKGISTPASLEGKRIAVPVGTSGDFFLDSLLVRQRLPRSAVRIIDRKPGDMVGVLEREEADAVATWEPYVSVVRKYLGSNASVFVDDGYYESTYNLASMRGFVSKRPEAMKRILRAMDRAERLMADDPALSAKILGQALDKPPEEARRMQDQNRYALTLEQNLLVLMEDQARWAVKNNVVQAKTTPNFLNAVHVDGLAEISPRSVTVIH
jgi:NitT/TauT family transport system substrate-binding protein